MRITPRRPITTALSFASLAVLVGLGGCSDLPTLSEANSRPLTPSEGQAWLNAAMADAEVGIEAFRGTS